MSGDLEEHPDASQSCCQGPSRLTPCRERPRDPTDLAETRTAMTTVVGGEDGLNASTTVDINAGTNVYNDVFTSIAHDMSVLTAIITSVQKDITSVQSADRQLGVDGVAGAANSTSPVVAARKRSPRRSRRSTPPSIRSTGTWRRPARR